MKYRIAAYISGSGSNLKAILDYSLQKKISSEVVAVIANKEAKGLEYPVSLGIETAIIPRKEMPRSEFVKKQVELLKKHNVDLIILAGYIRKLPKEITDKFKNRIINIHPALLPKFGGKGMYGMNVHRAVIEAKEKYSGPTIHFVDDIYDNGEILLQKKVEILEEDTPETLQKKVLELEHIVYPEAIRLLEERREN
ncbi:MAG: phosphoribosylglycinamide formyltransferase [Candidatus Delongbacteria bacterium]|nr:phosphoribosylglycinamide formyltransferase [Candidatus Delongbacteria bacterium]